MQANLFIDDTQTSFYYLRDSHNKPMVTVCLVRSSASNKKVVARGISICSTSDVWNPEVGQKQAYRHALRALKGRECQIISRNDAKEIMECVGANFRKHNYTSPKLTGTEKAILPFI